MVVGTRGGGSQETAAPLRSIRFQTHSTCAAGARTVLFINQFYYPDRSATSQLLQQLAEDLAAQGFRVSVLTGSPGRGEEGVAAPRKQQHRGVSIIRMRCFRFGRGMVLGQALDYLSFHLLAFLHVLLLPRFEVVVTLTTPPLIGWVGVFARLFRKSRFVYWVQDVYPEVAAALGTISSKSWLYRLCSAVSRFALHSADRVVAVGEILGQRLLESGAAPEKMWVLHNWAVVPAEQTPVPGAGSSADRHGLEARTVVLYSGNFGRAHLFDELLSAAGDLEREPGIEFVLVGSGNQAAYLAEQIRRRRLTRVRILPPVPLDRLADLLGSATIGLVTQNPNTAGLLVPSKLYSLMAAGKPVLFVGPGMCEAARIIRAAGCGFVIDPGDAAGLAEAIRRSIEDPGTTRMKGAMGREWLVAHGSRSRAVAQFSRLLKDLPGASPLQHRGSPSPAEADGRTGPVLTIRVKRAV